MGDVMFGRGNPEKALECWNAAVEHFPERWQSYCDRADGFRKLGRYQEALADYERSFSMQKPPRIADGLYSMAQVHELLGDHKMPAGGVRDLFRGEHRQPEAGDRAAEAQKSGMILVFGTKSLTGMPMEE